MVYLYLLLTLILSAAIIVILAKRIASHTFQCRHCSKSFRIRWSKVVITEHVDSEYLLTCPNCQARDWCAEQK